MVLKKRKDSLSPLGPSLVHLTKLTKLTEQTKQKSNWIHEKKTFVKRES